MQVVRGALGTVELNAAFPVEHKRSISLIHTLLINFWLDLVWTGLPRFILTLIFSLLLLLRRSFTTAMTFHSSIGKASEGNSSRSHHHLSATGRQYKWFWWRILVQSLHLWSRRWCQEKPTKGWTLLHAFKGKHGWVKFSKTLHNNLINYLF